MTLTRRMCWKPDFLPLEPRCFTIFPGPLDGFQVSLHQPAPLQVMFYEAKSKTFQNRVVKVDKQLSFFFVLEERQSKQPVAVRLYEIDEALPLRLQRFFRWGKVQ